MLRDSTEKSMGLALTVSFILHVLLYIVLGLMPQASYKAPEEPIMVDLQDLPQMSQPVPRDEKQVKRHSENMQRVPVESAPKGELERDKQGIYSEMRPVRPQIKQKPGTEAQEQPKSVEESLFRPKEQRSPDVAKLYPDAGKLARLEDSYRKKYEEDVREYDTKFLNTNDFLFGSFWRRFQTAVYGTWRYPTEALKLGIEGVTTVRITFSSKGVIENVEILESSGSRILDDNIRLVLSQTGIIGPFPKGYDKDTLTTIVFFQHGIIRGSSRSKLF